MITHDDNGYSRLKKWREAHRGIVNLKQREYRRRKKEKDLQGGLSGGTPVADAIQSPPSPAKNLILENLRKQIIEDGAIPPEPVLDKPKFFRDDYGRPITERQWDLLQKRKAEAENNGYQIDDYSQ